MSGKRICILIGIVSMIVIPNVCWTAEGKTPIYPAKSVDAVVPFAPGAGTDLMGRVVAEALARRWKYPVNVVNKPGGNTHHRDKRGDACGSRWLYTSHR